MIRDRATLMAFKWGTPIIIYSEGATIAVRLKAVKWEARFYNWLVRAIAVVDRP